MNLKGANSDVPIVFHFGALIEWKLLSNESFTMRNEKWGEYVWKIEWRDEVEVKKKRIYVIYRKWYTTQ